MKVGRNYLNLTLPTLRTGTPKWNKGRAAGALSVPPPTDHVTHRERGVILRPEKPNNCQTVKYNMTCSHSYRKKPGSSRKAISISPLRSPPNRRSALPVRHVVAKAQKQFDPNNDFINVTALNQNARFFSKDIANAPCSIAKRPAPHCDVTAGQAWSGSSPASTRTTGVGSHCLGPRGALRTSSQMTAKAHKLLFRRSQESRKILDEPRNFAPLPSCGSVEAGNSPFRIVLRMTNKR